MCSASPGASVVTDVVALQGCPDTLFVVSASDPPTGGVRWLIEARPDAITGARLFVSWERVAVRGDAPEEQGALEGPTLRRDVVRVHAALGATAAVGETSDARCPDSLRVAGRLEVGLGQSKVLTIALIA